MEQNSDSLLSISPQHASYNQSSRTVRIGRQLSHKISRALLNGTTVVFDQRFVLGFANKFDERRARDAHFSKRSPNMPRPLPILEFKALSPNPAQQEQIARAADAPLRAATAELNARLRFKSLVAGLRLS